MILTGKCKEEFEKWYNNWEYVEDYYITYVPKKGMLDEHKIISLNDMPNSMKFGVYQDYFDSVGLVIVMDAGGLRYEDKKEIWYQSGVKGYKFTEAVKSRQEARTKAIEKANELRNEVLNR